jgi:hypothetical protein
MAWFQYFVNYTLKNAWCHIYTEAEAMILKQLFTVITCKQLANMMKINFLLLPSQ